MTLDEVLSLEESGLPKLLAIVREMKISQVFGSTDVQKVLTCSPATATNVIKKMKNLGVIVPITGRGKGKYQLKGDE